MASRRATAAALLALVAAIVAVPVQGAEVLTTLDYHVVGVALRPARTTLAIPKNVPGSVRIELVSGGSGDQAADVLAAGAIVEATLRGPSFPARRVVGLPNGELLLPPLPLVGDYSLDDLRLVDVATGATRLDGSPRSVPINVFDDVLVSRVTSRPLTLDEIEDRGIAIDESNFRVLEFEVGFVIDGATVPVRFPVVAPRFDGAVELIPKAELEALLATAELANAELSLGVKLPEALESAGLAIEIQGINFQFVDPGDGDDLALSVPPIPGLLVVPGRIGMLNQFFSVMLFTENAAPQGSGLSVRDLEATLVLPPGLDQLPGTFVAPGDDPLRFARVGEAAEIEPTKPVRALGPDGLLGTADDRNRLQPGDAGQAEFLVEGLKEGLHVMDLTIDGTLDGLGSPRRIRGFAAGSVLVRNPKFSMAFTHPRTIRAQEPYTASVTILNTSTTPANLVSVTLPEASISGAIFEPGTPEVAELGTILPGETKTAEFRLRAQRTGSITFSQITTDADLVGRFRLRMGVDERGVALSPDAIGFPDFAEDLRASQPTLFRAIERVLGQALSIATAAQLPAGVLGVSRGSMNARVVEIAEAGQRLRYGDASERVLADLLLDFQGARSGSAGLDQIWRETDAGRELREAFLDAIAVAAAEPDAVALLARRAQDLAGRGEPWIFAATSAEQWSPRFEFFGASAGLDDSEIGSAAGFSGAPSASVDGHWVASRPLAGTLHLLAIAAAPAAEVALLDLAGNGSGRLLRWSAPALPAGACLRASLGGIATPALAIDEECNGVSESSLVASIENVVETAPAVLGVVQDESVLSGRPAKPCPRSDILNYGTVVAVLFSKPMTQSSVDVPAAYQLDGGNVARSVQIQPGGRVALLNLAQPIGTIVPRTLSIASDVTDPRGIPLVAGAIAIDTTAALGVAVSGIVVRGTGEPATDVPVTLTIYDEILGFTCEPFITRPAQARTDAEGRFHFDFVPAGIPYSVSATDTTGLSSAAEALILEASSDERLERDKLLELANGSAQGSLLESFLVGALPEAIAAAEGLDRALLRDAVDEDSARVGTEVSVALRFRGRGTLTGSVFEADGVTPARNAAVNLFADPDSRELGRGLFADDSGRFAFFGVPLGNFSIEATSPTGRTRTVSGLLANAGAVQDVSIVLSSAIVSRGAIEGRVVEAEDGAAHGNARVFVGFTDEQTGDFVVLAAATADPEGRYRVEAVPVGAWTVLAISFDGRRTGTRANIAASVGAVTFATVTLQGRTRVRGRVEFANGEPGGFALVAGGEAIVHADADGNFELSGVPTGGRTIEAAVEADPARGIDFTRIGAASLDVIAGLENFVTIRLAPAGRIVGVVRDANNNPVPNIIVSIPQQGGFLWVKANAQGRFEFPNLGLDDYVVSAPAPPVEDTDVGGILDALAGSPTNEDLQAAITRAFEIFTGVNNPLLNGEGLTFNPGGWGFSETTLAVDGRTAVVNVRFLPKGTIAGTVRNGQGAPIGARVRLTGVGPTREGGVGFMIRGERNSDPALGTFSFTGEALAGDFGVQAASPFFPSVISTSGQTSRIDPDRTDLLLQFPSEDSISGRLVGTVFGVDGRPVGEDVVVKIDFSPDYQIETVADGSFDTQISLPAFGEDDVPRTYTVEADDGVLRGRAFVTLRPGVVNRVDVHLLPKDGVLRVRVLDGTGQPVTGAQVDVQQGTFPADTLAGVTGASGELSFQNLVVGSYGVQARAVVGATAQRGSISVSVGSGDEALAIVRLGATATLRGTFVGLDRRTPIAFAQLRINGIGFASTDADGSFEMTGIPLGTHLLIGQDSVSGRLGTLNVVLTSAGEIRDVLLVERALGLVEGAVIDGFGNAAVPGASVTLATQDGFSPSRTVTTDPAGRFAFPGTPAGAFELSAATISIGTTAGQIGRVSASLPAGVARLQIDVPLQALTTASFVVLEADGLAPADATVTIGGGVRQSADTDAAGRVVFAGIPLGTYSVEARSRDLGRQLDGVSRQLEIDLRPIEPEVTLVLPGTGRVEGRLFASNGTTPVANRLVQLSVGGEFSGALAIQSDLDGRFAFDGVPLSAFRLVARDGALAATDNGVITFAGEIATLDLVLGPSGNVTGRLVSQDGALPIDFAEIGIAYAAPSGALGSDGFRTAADGVFHFEALPVGGFAIDSFVPQRNGVLKLSGAITSDGETVDLGDVRLDEEDPRVVASAPIDGDQEVAIDTVIRLTMNEALDPATIDPRAIFVRSLAGASVPAEVTLVEDPSAGDLRVLEIRPDAPLESETDYEAIVVDGDLVNAVGTPIAEGPRDLVGRILAAPFVLDFRTRDQDPPGLLSITPPNGAVQIDPRAVLRLSFDEPIAASGIAVTLTGPNGAVPGRIDVGVGAQVVVFTPTTLLAPNASYSAQINGVRDLAGNLAEDLPFISNFATLDTVGPTIAQLTLSGGAVGGATVAVNAVLAQPEAGASVRMSADLVPFGASAPGVLSLPFALPLSGTRIVRAIAIDRFGNEGPIAELPIAITANQAPGVAFTRLAPVSGAVPSGSALSVRVSGNDDIGVATLKAAAGGAANVPLVTSGGAAITLSIPVPAATGPGANVLVLGEAIDGNGQSSGEQLLSVAVSDGTAPSVAFTAPAAGQIAAGTPLAVAVAGNDNFGVVRFELSAEGAVTTAQQIEVVATPGAATANFSVPIPAGLANGETFTLRVRAFDAAGNSAEAQREMRTPDTRAPRLVSFAPANGAGPVGLRPAIVATFDEALAPASLTAIVLQLRGADFALVPALLTLSADARSVVLTPTAPLQPGTANIASLRAGVTDLAGNLAVAESGAALTPRTHTFTTGTLTLTQPAAGQRVIEGQTLALQLDAGAELDVAAAAFFANDAPAGQDATPPSPFRVDFAVPSIATLGGPALRIRADALLAPDLAAVVASEVTLEVFSAVGDADGDGIANGVEIGAGLDPFADDRLLDDDGDGLDNADEFARGTEIDDADSDDDGLDDGAEIAAGLDPRNPDSDGDGIPDGQDGVGGPRLTALEPAAAATNVSVRPRLRARFDDALARASVTAASFRLLENGATPIAAHFVFSDGDRTVDLVPDAPLAFQTAYTLVLTGAVTGSGGDAIRNPDGSNVATLERAFTTGVFGILAPRDGDAVRERQSFSIAAGGDAALGIAAVRFEVDGVVVATDSTAPFAATATAPSASQDTQLEITAVALDALAVELARDTIGVSVVVGLRVESTLVGVPLGGTRELVLKLPVARAEALVVTTTSDDPAVVGVPTDPIVIAAGALEARVPLTGLAEGSTALVVTTLEDTIGISASVSTLASGTALSTDAPPVGAIVLELPSLGDLILPLGAPQTLRFELLAAPRAVDTTFIVSSSNPAVAQAGGLVIVPAGETAGEIEITVGVAGDTTIAFLAADRSGRQIRILTGTPPANQIPPILAAPIGTIVLELPSLGDLILPLGEAQTLSLELLAAPLAVDTTFTVTSSDPAVAQGIGSIVVPAGQTAGEIEITVGTAGVATISFVTADRAGRQIRILTGTPPANQIPPIFAPPVGTIVLQLPSLGDLILPLGTAQTLRFELLAAPLAVDTTFAVSSSDPGVAQVPASIVVPAGETGGEIEITPGIAGETTIAFLTADRSGRQIRILTGTPPANQIPPILAPPVGTIVLELPSLGDLLFETGALRSVTLAFLDAPVAQDVTLVVSSSDPNVAQVIGSVVVPAGEVEAPVLIQTGVGGEADLAFLSNGRDGRTVRVFAGDPGASRTPPILAAPIGVVVFEEGRAGTLFIEPGATRSVTLDLLGFPSLVNLPVSAVSLDPSVATVTPANQLIATGTRATTLTINAGAAAGRTRIDLVYGVDQSNLLIEVGVPPAERVPPTLTPPVFVCVPPNPCEDLP